MCHALQHITDLHKQLSFKTLSKLIKITEQMMKWRRGGSLAAWLVSASLYHLQLKLTVLARSTNTINVGRKKPESRNCTKGKTRV
jgi:hypothetical protein